MSYCGALPIVEGATVESDIVQSDSHLIVDACLAHIRADARLDDEPVLPPLHSLLPPRSSAAVRIEVRRDPPPRSVWSVRASSPSQVTHMVTPPAWQVAGPAVRIATKTAKIEKRSIAQRMRWPVFVCGFLAGVFSGVALMKSPVGEKPAVRHVIKAVRHRVALAFRASSVAKSHLIQR
jgi:hypothetical protein